MATLTPSEQPPSPSVFAVAGAWVQKWRVTLGFGSLGTKTVLAAIALSLVITIFLDYRRTPQTSAAVINKPTPAAIDTHVPAGFSLVPIEIRNLDALNAIVGPFAMVDLFTMEPGQRSRRIAARVRLIRAPLDPNQFAVLVPSELTTQITATLEPLFVSVQNPKHRAVTHRQARKNQRRLIMEEVADEEEQEDVVP